MTMKLTILGCEGPWPTPGGGCSSYLVETGGKRILMETGSGMMAHLSEKMAFADLDAVILSHLHFDHMGEMPLLGYALMNTDKKLPVYLPAEPAAVRSLLEGFGCFECHTVTAGDTALIGEVQVSFLPARHPVPAVGVKLSCAGKTLCYSGDTNTLEGLAENYRDADLLLIDGGLSAAAWAEGKPHLSAAMAAQAALDCGAKAAVLTHFAPGQRELLLAEAQAVNPDMLGAEPGRSYEL